MSQSQALDRISPSPDVLFSPLHPIVCCESGPRFTLALNSSAWCLSQLCPHCDWHEVPQERGGKKMLCEVNFLEYNWIKSNMLFIRLLTGLSATSCVDSNLVVLFVSSVILLCVFPDSIIILWHSLWPRSYTPWLEDFSKLILADFITCLFIFFFPSFPSLPQVFVRELF